MHPIPQRAARLLVTALLGLIPASALAQSDANQGLHPPGSGADLVQDRGVPQAGEAAIPYVIVTTGALRPAFLELGRARIRNGIRSAVRSLESLQSAYPDATDDPDRIRRFLRDAYDIWGTRYVLLGGDADMLPPRFVSTTGFIGERHYVCDWYFACLDGTWDADQDGRYGEGGFLGDNPDLVPELYLGRAPVSTPTEARRFVDKTLGYEQRADDGFEQTTIMFADVLAPVPLDLAPIAEQLLPLIADDPAQQVTRLYETFDNPAWVPGALQETPAAVLAAMSQGANVTIGFGAGDWNVMEAGSYLEPNPYLTVSGVLGLTNGDRAGHVWLHTALVNAFDHPTSLAEAFLKAPGGGAVTVIAPSDITFVGEGAFFTRRFVEVVFDEGAATIGEALVRARAGMSFIVSTNWQLLGDPMLRVFSRSPVASATGGTGHGRTGINRLSPTRDEAPGRDLPLAIRADAGPAPETRVGSAGVAPGFALAAPVPSPSTGGARIALTVPAELGGVPLDARVIDLAGRTVRTLASGPSAPGVRMLAWDLRSERGERVRPGVYFVHVTAAGQRRTARLVVAD